MTVIKIYYTVYEILNFHCAYFYMMLSNLQNKSITQVIFDSEITPNLPIILFLHSLFFFSIYFSSKSLFWLLTFCSFMLINRFFMPFLQIECLYPWSFYSISEKKIDIEMFKSFLFLYMSLIIPCYLTLYDLLNKKIIIKLI